MAFTEAVLVVIVVAAALLALLCAHVICAKAKAGKRRPRARSQGEEEAIAEGRMHSNSVAASSHPYAASQTQPDDRRNTRRASRTSVVS